MLLLLTGTTTPVVFAISTTRQDFQSPGGLAPKSVTVVGGLPPYAAVSSNSAIAKVTQGSSPNLIATADSLTGWNLTGLTAGTGGVNNANDFEYLGTGSNASTNLQAYVLQNTIPGNVYQHSWWVDPSQVTHGGLDFKITSSDGLTTYQDISPIISAGGAAQRYTAGTWTCPGGVSQVRLIVLASNAQSGGFIVANGQTFKVSQPMFTLSGTDYTIYLSPTSVFTVTPVYQGEATIVYSDSTP